MPLPVFCAELTPDSNGERGRFRLREQASSIMSRSLASPSSDQSRWTRQVDTLTGFEAAVLSGSRRTIRQERPVSTSFAAADAGVMTYPSFEPVELQSIERSVTGEEYVGPG
ncbi:MAG: hypothetical protein ACREDL_10580, partial [Bradyrhizobium sp.]